MKIALFVMLSFAILLTAYLLGPRPEFESFDNEPIDFAMPLAALDGYLSARESRRKNLKPANEARILWQKPATRAPCAIVYLHGFSASHAEGEPIHRNLAERFGCNLYLTRLPGHGISGDDAFAGIEPRDWVDEARQAIAIGKLLGERLIVMATSTGATLATFLAAADADISALIFYSPNFELSNRGSHLLNGPWGKSIARFHFAGDYREWEASAEVKKFWTSRYHLDGLHALRHLVTATMSPDLFAAVEQPVFIAYYYRDDDSQDEFVSVEKMHEFLQRIGTPANQRRHYPAANADSHPIASSLWNENWRDLQHATIAFFEEVLLMKQICASC